MRRGSENLLTWPIFCVLSDRMGVVSSKRQVKEKGKGRWSPEKASTQGKEAPPLPPLVSDCCAQLEGWERGTRSSPARLVCSQHQRHLWTTRGTNK